MKNPSLFILLAGIFSFLQHVTAQDTCTVNDDCANAIFISNVISDQGYVCTDGCNMYASPDSLIQTCQMGDFPTVWYKVQVDANAQVMNIQVNSNDFDAPSIMAFKGEFGCNSLEVLYLTNSNLTCLVGTEGEAKAIGTPVSANGVYYIAVSSNLSIGGNFSICISTLSTGSACVVDRNIEIIARSNGGPLEGPFDPAETVSVCMNVFSYTAAGNGCQWFQGIIPVFGNGWDPASLDNNAQPLNATINGLPMGEAGNGLYGSATWKWFIDVDYHYDNPSMNINDFDNNGTVDMCNSSYEIDCEQVGVTGGCCGPCWGSPDGTVLPPGWFATGINGTCADTSGPVRVDWGDGNTCSENMGPWSFCFNLQTRDIPDCQADETTKDLTLGYYTFADGEIGSWTGSQSVCAYDHPVKLSLKAKCGRVLSAPFEYLPPLCTGDTLRYTLNENNIAGWDWNISPFWAAPYLVNHGENGFVMEVPLENVTSQPVDIHATLIGYEAGSTDVLVKKFSFKLNTAETCNIVSTENPVVDYSKLLRVFPMPVTNAATLEWNFDLADKAVVNIFNSQGELVKAFTLFPADGHSRQFETGDLLPGIYFLSVSNNQLRRVTKLVKI